MHDAADVAISTEDITIIMKPFPISISKQSRRYKRRVTIISYLTGDDTIFTRNSAVEIGEDDYRYGTDERTYFGANID